MLKLTQGQINRFYIFPLFFFKSAKLIVQSAIDNYNKYLETEDEKYKQNALGASKNTYLK